MYAEIGFTLFYPLVFAGLILMLTGLKPGRVCVCMGLEALIITLSLLGVGWYFLIDPTFLLRSQTQVTTGRLVTLLSYPCWDILLILAVVLIIRHCAARILHLSQLLCAAGLLAVTWADTAYAYFTALGIYHPGTFYIDSFWFIGALSIGLCGLYQYTSLAHKASSEGTYRVSNEYAMPGLYQQSAGHSTAFRSVLVFLPFSILLALTLSSQVIGDNARVLFLLVLTALVSILVAVRYLLSIRGNELLPQERQRLQEVEQLYQQLQMANQHLRELDELKDQFLMSASHELRTPLTAVQGYLELMAQLHDQLPHQKRWEYLQKARRSCDTLVMLLSNVMDASRLEVDADIDPAHMESVSIQEMIQSVLNLLEPRVTQEQREVDLHIPPDLHVRADPGRLRQVLLNISINALKYSPPPTPIAFAAQITSASHSTVIISVTDRGKGIAPQDQSRVFQRFVRLERDRSSSTPGSGLGLYISYRLIEAMGGKIWIESQGIAGEGTTFHIQLPIGSCLTP
jgi:signal transduction histidine kinase